MWVEGVLYLEENQSMVVKIVRLFVLLLFCLSLVYLHLILMGDMGLPIVG